jgi:hypothetical protein
MLPSRGLREKIEAGVKKPRPKPLFSFHSFYHSPLGSINRIEHPMASLRTPFRSAPVNRNNHLVLRQWLSVAERLVPFNRLVD